VAIIYGLVDPETREVRYVGKTTDLRRRLYDHLRATDESYRGRWIRSLLAKGVTPATVILADVPDDDWQQAERDWIAHFETGGARLTNGSDGGRGGSRPGHHMSPEANARRIAAVRAAVCGREVSQQTRAKMAAAKRGRSQAPEHRAKIAAALRGKPKSPEHVTKVAQRQIGRNQGEETRRKIAQAKKGQSHPQTVQTRLKIAATRRAKYGKSGGGSPSKRGGGQP
jgi:hypothetical protein